MAFTVIGSTFFPDWPHFGQRDVAFSTSGGTLQQSANGYFVFWASTGAFTDASNPVFETDSAIFFGSVFEGS